MRHIFTTRQGLIALLPAPFAIAVIASTWTGSPSPGFWFWLSACFAGELLWVRLPVGGITMNMALACNLAAIVLLPRGDAVVAAAAATLVAEAFFMRKPVVRFLYNSGQTVLAVFAGATAWSWVAGPVARAHLLGTPQALAGMAAAAVAFFAVNSASVSLAVCLADGISFWRAWRLTFGTRFNLFSSGALFSLGGLLAIVHALAGPIYTLLGVLPVLITYAAYRGVHGQYARQGEDDTRRAA